MPGTASVVMHGSGGGEIPVWFAVGMLVILGILIFVFAAYVITITVGEIREMREKKRVYKKRKEITYWVRNTDGTEEGM